MDNNKIETRGATLSFEENKYLHVVFKPKVSIDLDIAKEISEATEKLVGQIPHGNIVDVRNSVFVSSDARKHFASQANEGLVGIAIFSNSKLQTGMVNLYFRFTKRKVENKLFTDIATAKSWIDSKL